MPRRNEQLPAQTAYWIRMENGKGYHVWSKKVLDKLIEEGKIKDTDRVQFCVAISN